MKARKREIEHTPAHVNHLMVAQLHDIDLLSRMRATTSTEQ